MDGCCKPEKETHTYNSGYIFMFHTYQLELFVCLAFSSRYTVCLACFFGSACLQVEELQPYFLTASAHLTCPQERLAFY